MTNDEVLKLVFRIRDDIEFSEDERGIVTVLEKQNHIVQRLLRRLHFRIPLYKSVELDKYCSAVFNQIDGRSSVCEIGKRLDDRFGEDVYPLYERLLLFLNYIERDCKYIERIDKGVVSS